MHTPVSSLCLHLLSDVINYHIMFCMIVCGDN